MSRGQRIRFVSIFLRKQIGNKYSAKDTLGILAIPRSVAGSTILTRSKSSYVQCCSTLL
jgi:hypothetical protein